FGIQLRDESIVTALRLKRAGGYGKALVCGRKWTVERFGYASDVSISVSVDCDSLALLASCATKERRIDQRCAVRREFSDEGIKPGSRSIEGSSRDGKVG